MNWAIALKTIGAVVQFRIAQNPHVFEKMSKKLRKLVRNSEKNVQKRTKTKKCTFLIRNIPVFVIF